MFGFFKGGDGQFFDLFREAADLSVQAAHEFRNLIQDLDHPEAHSRMIKDIEHKADEVTHQTIELLHKTFITPLDREDIHLLISELDDVVDFLDAASQRIALYEIRKIPNEIKALTEVCVNSTEFMKKAIYGLNNLKNPDEVRKNCVEINRLENEADSLLRQGMAKLFKEEPDTRQLIKLKELYELLETVTDRCEDVANVIEGIILEYA